jgi:glucokinase
MTSQAGLDLIADIGGTNARFALTDPAAPEVGMIEARSLPNAEFASLQHAIEHYLGLVQVQPRRAAIAVASPVDADEIRLTNRAWSFSRRELQSVLGLEQLRLLNDFGAVAWAVPALQVGDREALYGPERSPLTGPITVIGPGTGLGVGLLVGSRERGWHVVETEGGHVSFAPLGDEEEIIARWLTARFGRASTERVLSGDGLSYIDAALRGEEPRPPSGRPANLRDPAAIVAAALDGHDHAARRALARFCAVFGSVAGDAALIHGARTVMIAGGIMPRFLSFLRSSAFRERFLAKGRFAAYLEAVGIEIVTHPHPGLLGAAVALRGSTDTESDA